MSKNSNQVGSINQLTIVEPFSDDSAKQYADLLLVAMNVREQRYKEMAAKVFDAVSDYPEDGPKLIANSDPVSRKITLSNPVGDALDTAITNCLNHRSIGYFIELILKRSESARQSARAIKRHAESYALKEDVFQWLELQPKFKSIEAAAMAIARQQPIAHVTARDWYKEWKKLRSASTP